MDVEVHFDAPDQFIEMFEWQLVAHDRGPQFPVHSDLWFASVTGAFDILAPFRKAASTFLCRDPVIIGHIINFPAESVQGGHGVALVARQEDESEREVGSAFARDGLADRFPHGTGGGKGWDRLGGRPPVWASVGLRLR
jgi:hypothetical protein